MERRKLASRVRRSAGAGEKTNTVRTAKEPSLGRKIPGFPKIDRPCRREKAIVRHMQTARIATSTTRAINLQLHRSTVRTRA